MEILLHSIIISAWCLGFRILTDEGQIFYFLRKYAEIYSYSACGEKRLISYLFKPLILCVTCTASIHGITLYLLMWGFDWTMIISIVFSTFINAFIWLIFERYVL